ncbi:hypothetical protein KIPB_004512 [Kipferlia bialata]|uniref:Uncharacterized protein n=1 Tax=Kipferlia bialata TaxID=797122 RepID=A0A9K3CTV9_9EUKA|nr:hypothetical protein KIPB_004512 [Kipferlia bialata]|eukprot:g4512.t1
MEMIKAVDSSSRKLCVGVLNEPKDSFSVMHVGKVLLGMGQQPIYGLYNQMPPSRIAVVPWDCIKSKSPSDRVFHQGCKIIVVLPEGAEVENAPLVKFLIRIAVSRVCIPVQLEAQGASIHKIPKTVLEGLSATPHLLTPTPGVPAFVSPVYSAAMRRILTGLMFTYAQKQYHPSCRKRGSGMEWFQSMDLLIRQISTLSMFMIKYGQDAAHIYDRPLLTSAPSKQILSSGTSDPNVKHRDVVRMVNHMGLSNNLLEVGRHAPPVDLEQIFTWPQKFLSGTYNALSSNSSLRYQRLMTDISCFQGPCCFLTPVQVELPLRAHRSLDCYDVLMEPDGSGSHRTGVTANTNRTGVSRHGFAQRGGKAQSITSGVSNVSRMSRRPGQGRDYDNESIASGVSHVSVSRRGSESVTGSGHKTVHHSVTKALETLGEEVRIALLCPDVDMAEKMAVPEVLQDLQRISDAHNAVMKQDLTACMASDFFGVIPLQYSVERFRILEDIRDLLSSLTAHADRVKQQREKEAELSTITHTVSRTQSLSYSVQQRETDDLEADLDIDSEDGDPDLDDESYTLLETVDSLQSSRTMVTSIYDLVTASPVSEWAEEPCDISSLSQDAKRALLFSLMVLYANTMGIRQANCRFEVGVAPPLTMDESPVVMLMASTVGFRMASDNSHPVVASYLMPRREMPLYISVTSDSVGTRKRTSSGNLIPESSDSSMSLVSLQVPGLTGTVGPVANIPVLLGRRRLGNVSLSDRIGADFWISIGAHFNIT